MQSVEHDSSAWSNIGAWKLNIATFTAKLEWRHDLLGLKRFIIRFLRAALRNYDWYKPLRITLVTFKYKVPQIDYEISSLKADYRIGFQGIIWEILHLNDLTILTRVFWASRTQIAKCDGIFQNVVVLISIHSRDLQKNIEPKSGDKSNLNQILLDAENETPIQPKNFCSIWIENSQWFHYSCQWASVHPLRVTFVLLTGESGINKA